MHSLSAMVLFYQTIDGETPCIHVHPLCFINLFILEVHLYMCSKMWFCFINLLVLCGHKCMHRLQIDALSVSAYALSAVVNFY